MNLGSEAKHDVAAGSSGGDFRLEFPGTPFAVRSALAQALRAPGAAWIDDDGRGCLELVLAEILNNIVEHAYDGACGGLIVLEMVGRGDRLYCDIFDDGREMPNRTLPLGRPADPNSSVDDLPEGGFGWFLIRELTHELEYRRVGERNHLHFQMSFAEVAKAG